MERPPANKKEEEMIINSGGDAKVQIPTTVVEPRWASTMGPWYNRLPEVFTMSWVALILIGALLLVFYSISLSTPKENQFIELNCNVTTPPSYNVFFHEIVPRDMPLPLPLYTDYITEMAHRYPNLKFHLIFLYDNELSMIPTRTLNLDYPRVFQEEDNKRIQIFQNKFNNVNITVTSLCKFLLSSPLRYKWRSMVPSYVPFYLRVMSVWMHGGVAVDMNSPVRNIHIILNQHNLGFKEPDYANAIKNLAFDSENIMDVMFDILKQYVNNPNKNFSDPKPPQTFEIEWPNRSQRRKRSPENYSEVNISLTSDSVSSKSTETTKGSVSTQKSSDLSIANKTKEALSKTIAQENMDRVRNSLVSVDFAFYVERPMVAPSVMFKQGPATQKAEPAEGRRRTCLGTVPYLTVLPEGSVVAATSRQHPLLLKLLTSPFIPVNPVDLLREFYHNQCSGSNAEFDPYCKKILIA